MTTPTRKSEIRRRWARARKLDVMRRHYKAAKTESEKKSIVEKLARLMPPMSAEDFLRPLQTK
jgi:hypothetical protein